MSVSAAVEQFTAEPGAFAERAGPGSYDEWFTPEGKLRSHQQQVHDYFAERDPQRLRQLQRAVRHRIGEQEVTFNILGAPDGSNRPWHLDAIPLVMDASEWQHLELGLQQRARLLSLMHQDFFGPQRLLHQGIVPAELVLGHPALARACFGWIPAGGHRLHVYAADVARDREGRFLIYSDRTAAPTGAGYALENRLVLGRTLSDLFHAYDVERVRGFFDVVRRCVQELAPQVGEEPRVVLLSAGSHDESSFEHAYLARYLGYELVEGRDLTVRDRVVYLKTLSGLKRVDVIFRRIHDEWCDPLALREDSVMGVPGLVDAAAAQNVALVNPLGVNVLEAAALKAYLPAASRFLLGESLLLDSVETSWCGDPTALKRVLANPDDHVFKPSFEDRRGTPWLTREMSSEERTAFLARLESTPRRFVAERWPASSSAPSLDRRGEAYYGHVAIRTFSCRSGDDYRVMPGGLARIDATPDGLFLAISGGEASKDVWVPPLQDGWERSPLGMPDHRVDLRRGGLELPSRLLDDIYWLGRLVERSEMTARLLRAGFDRLDSEAGEDAELALSAIVDSLETIEVVHPSVGARSRDALDALFMGALLDASYSSSLRSVCHQIHRLTLGVRSRLSRDAWHVLKRLSHPFQSLSDDSTAATASEVLDDILLILSAVGGTTLDNMVRGHAWMFLDMGRRVERGALTVGLMQAMLPSRVTRVHMEALLEVADSLLTYRSRYLSSLQVAPVVDLLLTDDTNPRSLLFQVNSIRDHIGHLPRLEGAIRSRAERRVIALGSNLLTADVVQACSGDGSGLRQLLEDCSTLMWQLSEDVTHTWFTHGASSHAVAPPRWVDEELEVR